MSSYSEVNAYVSRQQRDILWGMSEQEEEDDEAINTEADETMNIGESQRVPIQETHSNQAPYAPVWNHEPHHMDWDPYDPVEGQRRVPSSILLNQEEQSSERYRELDDQAREELYQQQHPREEEVNDEEVEVLEEINPLEFEPHYEIREE